MHGCVTRLAADMDEVFMKATFHTIESQLASFGKCLDTLPNFTIINSNLVMDPIPSSNRSNQVAHSLDNNNSPTPYRFYTDGSLH